MKKLINLFFFICVIMSFCFAQKNTTTTATTPNSRIVKILPDLTFDLIPVLSSGGNGYEPVAGIPGRIKIPVRFIVKNIGNDISKTCKVQIEVQYQGARSFKEVEQGVPEGSYNRTAISETMELQPIEKGKDALRNHAFIFSKFPEEAWGKRVKLIAHIIYPVYNGEISTQNNYSNPYEFDLVK
jgi:hypothetical protein